MNSREDLHSNLSQWTTGSRSVDQELHEVIDRAFDLEAVMAASEAFEMAVSLNMIAGGKVAPVDQAIRLMEGVRRTHRALRDALARAALKAG